MSHAATNWLAALRPDVVANSEFRVLFHLCDCHNMSQGCYPTQRFLSAACGLSRSTVNVALARLEEKGLIWRQQSIDERTRRQRPTRYILGFEMTDAQEPCPKTGHGNSSDPCHSGETRAASEGQDTAAPEPCPISKTRAVSENPQKPCPKNGKSRVRPAGHKPVNKPENKPNARVTREAVAEQDQGDQDTDAVLRMWSEKLRAGGYVPQSALSPMQAQRMVALNLITAEELKSAGIAC
ncbi:helix-turn-helix domain-containing protein [Pseudogemmobacter humi]|uniref:MarR family protein n=1 Tax=Pseudogemmobacter humi TaxID=2483812 RepID=A0A3P5XA69_9RHOB|nr:helix-turn-helix domain-containing protein [Pseudogemmobacter humi]VDC31398.1 MarR family protein [Pseudogemmobacter humi]